MTIRVLLVDDVDDVRRLVRIALRHRGGFEVVGEADAGLRAVDLASSLHPDVVLLDLGLPDLAGRDVLSRVREASPDTKIIVFTGAEGEDREFYEENAAGYVTKSGDLDYLIDLVDGVSRSAARDRTAHFPPEVSSVAQSREFVRSVLREWDCDRMGEDASLVVSELASNAVVHARSPYQVRLRLSDGVLRIEVADDALGTPEPQPFSATAEGGRGIVVVSAISTSWGIESSSGHGKVTWAELNPG